MSFSTLLWSLSIAWAISCGFYFNKIIRVCRASGVSVFSSLGKSNRTSHFIIRKLLTNILIATFLFGAAVLIAYFVRFSS
jgi:hypothetical protein